MSSDQNPYRWILNSENNHPPRPGEYLVKFFDSYDYLQKTKYSLYYQIFRKPFKPITLRKETYAVKWDGTSWDTVGHVALFYSPVK